MLTEPWHIQLLGGLVANQQGVRVQRFRTRKVATLLAYLALHNCVPISREFLGEMLWPEEDVEVSRNRLRVTLASLRKQLEPPLAESGSVLVANRSHVWLRDGSVITDVDQFRGSVVLALQVANEFERADALRIALDIHRGELLPDVYEDWVVGERRALEQLYNQTASAAIDLLCNLGMAAEALPYALRLSATDPLDERAQGRLIQVYSELGQPGNAANIYEALRTRLHEDLGITPTAETKELIAQLRRNPQAITNRFGDRSAKAQLSTLSPAVITSEEVRFVELPSTSSSFHGRQSDLHLLKSILAPNECSASHSCDGNQGRLVTLTGLGGIGKTRLALQAAVQCAANFPGGAWFVPLADVEDGRLIGQAIADVFRIRLVPHKSVVDQLVDELRAFTTHGPALLLLDNYEQLVGQSTGVVEVLLARVPALWIVATSRRLLGLTAEREFRVEPLEIPDQDLGVEMVIKSASVALFVARAQATIPNFRVTPENAMDIAALCNKLEGIPLAIELAAARIRLLTPAQMIAEMEQRFELLVNRRATKASRHSSLRGAIARSVQMLPMAVREFFATLSVFRGSWNLEAARAVTGYSDALDKMDDLAGYSLIQTRAAGTGGEMRYSMLETIREFATALIPFDQQPIVNAQHARFYRNWTHTRELITLSAKRERVLYDYEMEKDNIRSAWMWALRHDTECALDIAVNLRWILFLQHRLREGEEMLLQSLETAGDVQTDSTARALVSLAALRCYMDDFAGATDPLQKGMDQLGPHQERERRLGISFRGWITMHQGDFDSALELLEEVRRLCASNGEIWDEGACYNLMGFAACYAGRLTQARQLFAASRERFELAGDSAIALHCLLGTGRAAWMEGKLDESEMHYRTGLAEFRHNRDWRGTAYALEGLARIASDRGFHYEAMRLTGASQRVRDQFALRWDPMDQTAHEAVMSAALTSMNEIARKSAWDEGFQLGEQAAD